MGDRWYRMHPSGRIRFWIYDIGETSQLFGRCLCLFRMRIACFARSVNNFSKTFWIWPSHFIAGLNNSVLERIYVVIWWGCCCGRWFRSLFRHCEMAPTTTNALWNNSFVCCVNSGNFSGGEYSAARNPQDHDRWLDRYSNAMPMSWRTEQFKFMWMERKHRSAGHMPPHT